LHAHTDQAIAVLRWCNHAPRTDLPMGIWKKLFGSDDEAVDYYNEGVELLKAGKYHEALTSFRLAQRESPRDAAVLQQIAIAYTRIGMTDEAIRTYRTVLSSHPAVAGAHYGLAFLLLRQGRQREAEQHLETFLSMPPDSPDAQRHVAHARETLEELRRGTQNAVPDQGS
jgi:Flp pilus assembly protein TadD